MNYAQIYLIRIFCVFTIYNTNYTTWKVDGATPMYWFIMAPY